MLGPLLFLIYINDINESVPNSKFFKKFADDTKMASIVNNNNDGLVLQTAIDNLHNWSIMWSIALKMSKNVTSFTWAGTIQN